MEQNETKVLPLALTKEQRTRLGVMAAERCVAMTELVRWWIDEKWGGRTSGPVVVKTPAVERKEASKESGYVDLNKVAPIPEINVETKQCASCRLKVKEWVYDKVGKPICPECAERLANSNP